MLRVLLVIVLLLLSVPLLNSASDYAENKFNQVKVISAEAVESVKKFFKKFASKNNQEVEKNIAPKINEEDKEIRSDPSKTKDLTH